MTQTTLCGSALASRDPRIPRPALLIGLRATASGAVSGVAAWRVLQFRLPVPVAGATYLWLRLSGRVSPRQPTPYAGV